MLQTTVPSKKTKRQSRLNASLALTDQIIQIKNSDQIIFTTK